jgi:hypothetical protein
MTSRSAQPPAAADTAPTTAPSTEERAAHTTAISRDTRSPAAVRTNRSRPAGSVPNGWSGEGARRAAEKSVTRSSTPASQGTSTA